MSLSIVLAVLGGWVSPIRAAASVPAPHPGYQVGDRAPNLDGFDQWGTNVSLYDQRGSYVLLDFSVVWCLPSNQMAANENQLVRDLTARGYPFVYVTMLLENSSFGSTVQRDASTWASRFHLTEPVLQLGGADVTSSRAFVQMSAYDAPSSAAFPTLVLLAPDLTILEVHVGYQAPADIEALLPPPPV